MAALYVIFKGTTQKLFQALCDALVHVPLMLILILDLNFYWFHIKLASLVWQEIGYGKKNKGERPQISGLHFLGKNYSGHQQDIRKRWDNTGLNRRSICEINFVKPKLHIGKQTSSVVSLHCNVLNSFLNVTALEFSFGRHPFSKVRADWLREWSSEEGHLLTEAKNEMLRTGPWFANVIVWNN